jgi:toxin ParE1/3/4
VARLRYSRAAQKDLGQIYQYIREKSGSGTIALRFIGRLRRKCRELAGAPIQMGRPRDKLRPGLRSHPFQNYVIYFHYLGDVLAVVNVLEGHRDVTAIFDDNER